MAKMESLPGRAEVGAASAGFEGAMSLPFGQGLKLPALNCALNRYLCRRDRPVPQYLGWVAPAPFRANVVK
jgi:hypothetical protein